MQLVSLGGAALRLTPPGRERLETARTLEVSATGPECNAAIAAGRLGAESTWLSRLPDGPLGRRVAGELRSHDLDVVADRVDGRQGVAFFERGARPRENGRIRDLVGSTASNLSLEALPTDPITGADAAYVTSSTAERSRAAAEATAKFLKTAHEADARTALGLLDVSDWDDVDATAETVEGLLPVVDVLVGTDVAIEAVFDRSGEPTQVTHALASAHDLDIVAIRRDNDAAVWQDSTVSELRTPETDAVDETGRADAFAGALLAGLAEGSARSALRSAVAADALTATTAGPIAVFTREEVSSLAENIGRA